MANHLLLGSAQPNWRLYVNESTDQFKERWDAAYDAQAQLDVQVVLADQLEPRILSVNPRAVPWWIIIDQPDADAV